MASFDSISRVLNTALALALGVTLWSCAVVGTSETNKTLWSYEDRYVRIEPQDSSSNTPPNEHPVTLPAAQLRAVLGALQVTLPKKSGLFSRSADKNETVPVFTDKELDVLSEAIARGLAQAGSRQDITFLTVGNHRFIFGDFIKKRQVRALPEPHTNCLRMVPS